MKIKLKYIPTIILTLTTAFAGFFLSSSRVGAVTDTDSADARVDVNDACTFNSNYDYTFSYSALNGTSGNTTSDTRPAAYLVSVTCNNISGFKIKAVGYSPDALNPGGVDGNTDMFSTTTSDVIPTGTATSGPTSSWAMRITSANVTAPTGTGAPTATIQSPFTTWASVPYIDTTVVQFGGSTSAVVEGNMTADYQFYVSQNQSAGSYTGKVKYTIVGD